MNSLNYSIFQRVRETSVIFETKLQNDFYNALQFAKNGIKVVDFKEIYLVNLTN